MGGSKSEQMWEVNQGMRVGRGGSEAGTRLWQQEVVSSDGQGA